MYPGEEIARGLVQTALQLARMESLLEKKEEMIWEGMQHRKNEVTSVVRETMMGLYDFTSPGSKGS